METAEVERISVSPIGNGESRHQARFALRARLQRGTQLICCFLLAQRPPQNLSGSRVRNQVHELHAYAQLFGTAFLLLSDCISGRYHDLRFYQNHRCLIVVHILTASGRDIVPEVKHKNAQIDFASQLAQSRKAGLVAHGKPLFSISLWTGFGASMGVGDKMDGCGDRKLISAAVTFCMDAESTKRIAAFELEMMYAISSRLYSCEEAATTAPSFTHANMATGYQIELVENMQAESLATSPYRCASTSANCDARDGTSSKNKSVSVSASR